MATLPPGPMGFLGNLRLLSGGLFATVEDRLQLFSVELQEEKFRLIQTFFWLSATVFTGMITLTFASLTLVYLFWTTARLAVLGGLAAFYAVLLLAIVLAFRRFLARQPVPFAATREEIGTGCSWVSRKN